ncbi:hypothetical protein B0T10DRAFT_501634 [Thelonectria olida]|uniref:Uncharacterized protein n=1 Tax=Thelonectria olida TaxID=1576542 RepID=A0A9P8VS37_9HYPO|nr:hypothetical protein B0T10DRAFT_501634 [Thelonectria olida]
MGSVEANNARVLVAQTSADASSPKLVNGRKLSFMDDSESELTDPGSSVDSQFSVSCIELEDKIVVENGKENREFLIHLSSDEEDKPIVYRRSRGKPTRSSANSVILGYWRGSTGIDEKTRHAVIGFLDVQERLRIHIKDINITGEPIPNGYPLPPGPGGRWITFERVVFSDHLVGLDFDQIKEYVRIRSKQPDPKSEEERKATEDAAVKEATLRVKQNPANDNNGNSPFIAYGLEMPDNRVTPSRPDVKRRRVSGAFAAINPAPANGVPQAQEPPPTPPRQSTTTQSSRAPADPLERSPRVRYQSYNLRHVEARTENRPLRQPLPEAEARPPVKRVQRVGALERTNSLAKREIARVEATQARVERHAASRRRATVAAAAADAANAAAATIPSVNGRAQLHESEEMQRLNKVWARQEKLRVKAGMEDAKIYGGVKYERKATGPLMGKLVSQGTILNIDGEDFVEYRVLTKPSFF